MLLHADWTPVMTKHLQPSPPEPAKAQLSSSFTFSAISRPTLLCYCHACSSSSMRLEYHCRVIGCGSCHWYNAAQACYSQQAAGIRHLQSAHRYLYDYVQKELLSKGTNPFLQQYTASEGVMPNNMPKLNMCHKSKHRTLPGRSRCSRTSWQCAV